MNLQSADLKLRVQTAADLQEKARQTRMATIKAAISDEFYKSTLADLVKAAVFGACDKKLFEVEITYPALASQLTKTLLKTVDGGLRTDKETEYFMVLLQTLVAKFNPSLGVRAHGVSGAFIVSWAGEAKKQ